MITARILGRTRIGVLVRNGHRVCDACLISGLFYTSARHSPGERVMATDLSFVEFISEQAALGARISHKKMFGEYAIYVDTKMVGLACDNSLFVKPAAMTSDLTAGFPVRAPYPGANRILWWMNCWMSRIDSGSSCWQRPPACLNQSFVRRKRRPNPSVQCRQRCERGDGVVNFGKNLARLPVSAAEEWGPMHAFSGQEPKWNEHKPSNRLPTRLPVVISFSPPTRH